MEERGSISVLSITVVAITALCMMSIGRFTSRMAEHNNVQNAADALALVLVRDHDIGRLEQIAGTFGVTVVRTDMNTPDQVRLWVRRDGLTASATATDSPVDPMNADRTSSASEPTGE